MGGYSEMGRDGLACLGEYYRFSFGRYSIRGLDIRRNWIDMLERLCTIWCIRLAACYFKTSGHG